MSDDDNDVFFVDSSEDERVSLGSLSRSSRPESSREVAAAGRQPAVSAPRQPPSPQWSVSRPSMSMENILFERPHMRQQRLPGAGALGGLTASDFEGGSSGFGWGNNWSPNEAPSLVPLEMLAGRSVNRAPVPVATVDPRDLTRLRGMTTSEVRETLETFFLRKDADKKKFKAAEVDIREKTQAARAAGTREDFASLARRDRCARLVNTGNWGEGEDSPRDVLLPAPLVPDSVYYTEQEPNPLAIANSNDNNEGPASPPPRTLRKHQIEGIRFMWNVLAEGPAGQVPAVGCILAHTMGLGKTAQVVLLAHMFAARVSSVSTTMPAPPLPRILIAVPKSTVSVWEREFASWSAYFPPQHRLVPRTVDDTKGASSRLPAFRKWRQEGGVFLIGYEALVRLMQHIEDDDAIFGSSNGGGGFRQRDQQWKASGDPAVSAMVRSHMNKERRRDEGGLAYGGVDDPFTELLVCDEAHRLKSVHLQVVTALRGLHPLRRLLLTGTPLQNHLSEYWAMIDFAVHKYFDRHRFKDFFVNSIESSVNKMASKQEVEMARKKTFTLINEVKHFVQRVDSSPLQAELPPLHEYVVIVPLSDLQRGIYQRFVQLIPTLYGDKGGRFHFLPAVSLAGKIASHPQLLFAMRGGKPANRPASPVAPAATKRAPERKAEKRGRGRRRRTQKEQRSGSSESHSDSDSASSNSNSDSGDVAEVVLDDEEEARASSISFSQLYANSTDYDGLCESPPGYRPRLEDGIKLQVAMNIVTAAIRRKEKTLLFSLSTKLLDFIEMMVAQVNLARNAAVDPVPIRYCRLDGSHSGTQRASMLSDFNSDDSGLNLFLLSMKAGGVGITITAATRVILVDSSFNPADDQQAIGRAYRYGQRKPVFVYRLLCHQTLEYSIFEQKLAKDWLFKTVIEETSMKRDGLSGMHLRQIFALLDRAARAMKRPPVISPLQRNTTDVLTAEDDVLASVRELILYAQRYEVFLSHDDGQQYGEAEQTYYEQYRKKRMFDVGDNVLPQDLLEAAAQQRQRQRKEQASLLQVQSQSLTGMVDRLIRSRASTDPYLSQLLTAMGLHVDAKTGIVLPTSSSSSAQSPPQRHTRQDRGDGNASREPSTPGLSNESPQAPRRLRRMSDVRGGAANANDDDDDDDDDEELRELLQSATRGAVNGNNSSGGNGQAMEENGPSAVVNPGKYAPYRPGGSANNAIDIDS